LPDGIVHLNWQGLASTQFHQPNPPMSRSLTLVTFVVMMVADRQQEVVKQVAESFM
jgi:hypothetical protein